MASMFYGCSSLTTLDLSGFDTSNVTNMSYMFNGCSSLTTLDLSGFDTRNVTNMTYMLYDCSNLTTIYASDNFVTNQVEDSTRMFSGCSKLIGGNGTTYNFSHINKEYAIIDTPETPGYFTSKESTIANTVTTPEANTVADTKTKAETTNTVADATTKVETVNTVADTTTKAETTNTAADTTTKAETTNTVADATTKVETVTTPPASVDVKKEVAE